MNEVRKSPAVQDRAKPLLSRFSNALASIVGKPSQKGQASSVGKGKEKTSKEKGLSPHNTATPQHPKINQEEAWAECQELAQEPRILDRFADDLKRCGLVGEKRAAKLVYLALTSRHLDRPISAVIKGPSSSGKSHLLDCTLRFFPPSAYYRLTAMSERALVYGNEPLKHRTLVVAEASGLAHGVGAYLIRSLISEGNLRYETVLKDKDKMGVVTFDREGPTGLLVTTTRCPSSKQMGLLSVFHKGGSGSSLFDVKPLGFDGSSGGFGWSVF